MTLSLRNQAQLDTLLSQLYNPGSPNFHQFLSVEEFTDSAPPPAIMPKRPRSRNRTA